MLFKEKTNNFSIKIFRLLPLSVNVYKYKRPISRWCVSPNQTKLLVYFCHTTYIYIYDIYIYIYIYNIYKYIT